MPRGQRQTRQPQVEGKLSNSLVLNRYILSLFGATSLEALSEHLKDPILEGWDENNVSYFYRELLYRKSLQAKIQTRLHLMSLTLLLPLKKQSLNLQNMKLCEPMLSQKIIVLFKPN